MRKNSMTEIAHLYLKHMVCKEDIVIDATMGHGHDTLYLANLAHQVYAFDIQKSAVESTKALLEKNQIDNVVLTLDSHENFDHYIQNFNGAIFNLGYLPHGDKSITTLSSSTITTLEKMFVYLPKNGYIILVVYPGHDQGYIESKAVDDYMSQIDPKKFKIIKTFLPYQEHKPPYILWITKN
jgi:tRNA G37 N-methylase Trm5